MRKTRRRDDWAQQQRHRQEVTAHLAQAQAALNPTTGFPPTEKELAQATLHTLVACVRLRYLDGFEPAADLVLGVLEGAQG